MRTWHACGLGCLLVAGCVDFNFAGGSDDDSGCGSRACPEGEVCSKATPQGLEFHGAQFADGASHNDPVAPIAAGGGLETITITDRNTGGRPSASNMAVQVPEGVFEAAVPEPWSVRLKALTPGSGYLRVFDRSTNELFDKVWISSSETAAITIHPNQYEWPQNKPGSGPFRCLMGNSLRLVAELQVRNPTGWSTKA